MTTDAEAVGATPELYWVCANVAIKRETWRHEPFTWRQMGFVPTVDGNAPELVVVAALIIATSAAAVKTAMIQRFGDKTMMVFACAKPDGWSPACFQDTAPVKLVTQRGTNG